VFSRIWNTASAADQTRWPREGPRGQGAEGRVWLALRRWLVEYQIKEEPVLTK